MPLPGAARNLLTQAGPYWAGTMPRWRGLSQGPQAAAWLYAQDRRGDRLGLLKQRNLMAPSPQRGCLPPRAAGWGPLCRGTCFSLFSQGGLRQVIPPCASVTSCPNKVASAAGPIVPPPSSPSNSLMWPQYQGHHHPTTCFLKPVGSWGRAQARLFHFNF